VPIVLFDQIFHGEVLCARRCDRGVSVLGHQDVAVL
jgi:hypothetical protein